MVRRRKKAAKRKTAKKKSIWNQMTDREKIILIVSLFLFLPGIFFSGGFFLQIIGMIGIFYVAYTLAKK